MEKEYQDRTPEYKYRKIEFQFGKGLRKQLGIKPADRIETARDQQNIKHKIKEMSPFSVFKHSVLGLSLALCGRRKRRVASALLKHTIQKACY